MTPRELRQHVCDVTAERGARHRAAGGQQLFVKWKCIASSDSAGSGPATSPILASVDLTIRPWFGYRARIHRGVFTGPYGVKAGQGALSPLCWGPMCPCGAEPVDLPPSQLHGNEDGAPDRMHPRG